MFGIGAGEFIVILIVGLIVFGPSKLPEVGRAIGKGLREFRKAQAALSATLEESVNETPKKAETKPAEVSLEKNSESVKVSTDEIFKTAKENTNTEIKSEKISTDENSVPKEIYTGTAAANEKSVEPARTTVDDLINTLKENPISNAPAEEKISKEKTA